MSDPTVPPGTADAPRNTRNMNATAARASVTQNIRRVSGRAAINLSTQDVVAEKTDKLETASRKTLKDALPSITQTKLREYNSSNRVSFPGLDQNSDNLLSSPGQENEEKAHSEVGGQYSDDGASYSTCSIKYSERLSNRPSINVTNIDEETPT